ncbi:MAG: hypothetical protein FJ225_03205 [Lentisphaerae bacterium]|nr:hypothetical protein [Lentisphaerota bacterium]
MSATDNIEKARVEDSSRDHPTLFAVRDYMPPAPTAEALCRKIGLNWMSALELHDDGYLSFDPKSDGPLSPGQEAELTFVGQLAVAGCDATMLKRLLSGLPKPYAYRAERVYYDWAGRAWRLLEEADELEDHFDDWLAELIGWQELDRLQRLRQRLDNAIGYLKDRRAGRAP